MYLLIFTDYIDHHISSYFILDHHKITKLLVVQIIKSPIIYSDHHKIIIGCSTSLYFSLQITLSLQGSR